MANLAVQPPDPWRWTPRRVLGAAWAIFLITLLVIASCAFALFALFWSFGVGPVPEGALLP